MLPQIDGKKMESQQGVYSIFFPAPEKEIPLLFDSPHSGRMYPRDFKTLIPFQQLETGEDRFVDELFQCAPDYGATLLTAEFPRSYIDLNRHDRDLEPEIYEGEWQDERPAKPSDKAKHGIGLIRRMFPKDEPLYQRPLAQEDILKRIEKYYTPYHQRLGHELVRLRKKFGFVVHIDCHSMPQSSAPALPRVSLLSSLTPFQKKVDLVFGDRDGKTMSAQWRDIIVKIAEESDFTTTMNNPYKGVEIVKRYGRPDKGFHCVQMEINRGLYLDRDEYDRSEDFSMLQTRLDYFMRGLSKTITAMLQEREEPKEA